MFFLVCKGIANDDSKFVNEVWSKVWAKFRNQIQALPTIKRNDETSPKAYINGINLATKFQVCKVGPNNFYIITY